MYKLFLDESKIFECNVAIEGSSIDNSRVRLILESDNYNFIFKGKISNDGKVSIPISKLKGILKENTKGKVILEVIADDTLFIPWTSDYTCEVKRKVEVSFSDKDVITENKQKVKVSFTTKDNIGPLISLLMKEGITIFNIDKKPKTVNKVIQSYLKENKLSEREIKSIIEKLPVELSNL